MTLYPPVFFCFIWALHQSLWSFPSFLAWASLHCNFICSVLWLRQRHPTQIWFQSPSYLALFLQGAHVWAYVRPTWLAGFFFLPPPPSLFHMSANTVMHTVSARSNCELGSISIFSSAGSGPASVNRWTSLQAAWPSMAYSPSGSPVSLKSQPLFYFEHDDFSLHVSRFYYVSMTLLRNLILKWAFQYIGHQEHLVHMHKVQSFWVEIWHKASVTFSYILSILRSGKMSPGSPVCWVRVAHVLPVVVCLRSQHNSSPPLSSICC